MTIIQGIQQRPLHHDYKQTKTLPVIMIHSFQTSVTDVRCWKWFTETSQIITVSGQTHTCPYHNYIYYTLLVYYSSTRKKTVLSSLSSMHKLNMHSFVVLCSKTFAFVVENWSNKITSDTDSLTNCWFFAGIIYMLLLLITFICWS